MNKQEYRIFVVDDNEDLREYLKETLLSKGYTVTCAGSAEETIEKIKDWPVDLFLIDLRMQGMGGIELLKKLDINNNTYEAIIITAYADMDSAKKAMEYGAFSYISKPIKYKELAPLMKKALEMVKLKKLRLEHMKELKKKVEARTKELKEENKKLKLIEGILRESEERYRNLLEQAPTGIVVATLDGKVVFGNRKMTEITGYSSNELKKISLSSTYDNPKNRKKLIELLNKNDIVNNFPVKLKRKDCTLYDAQLSVSKVHVGGQDLLQTICVDITEKKKAEEALRKSEESYKRLADSITDVFFAMDEGLKYTYWNKTSEKLYGISAKNAIGKSILDIFPDDNETREALRKYKEVLKKKQSQNFINEYTLNGKKYFFEINAYPSENGLSVFVKDITERKKAEEALYINEERYRTVVNSISDLVFVIDENGCFKECYTANPELLYKVSTHFIGKKHSEIMPKEINDKFEKTVKKVRKNRKTEKYEYTLKIKGEEGWFLTNLDLHTDGKSIVAAIRDITDLKKVENLLRLAEESWRNSFNSLEDVMLIIDKDYNIGNINKNGLKLLGKKREEVIGKKCYQIIHGKKKPGEFCPFKLTLKTKKVSSIERYIEKFDKYFSINTSPIFNKKGEIIKFVDLMRDITARKKVEDELMSSQKQLRDLTAHLQSVREQERTSIAREIHDELGQILTALKMDLSWLNKKLPEDQKKLSTKTVSMSKLIDSTIKTVKRISTELRPGLLDDLGLSAAIEWQADEFSNRTGIKCEVSADFEEDTLNGDLKVIIFRIFQETLTNVSRHAEATKVKVNLREKKGKLEMKVSDNGKGIEEKQISDHKSYGLIGIKERARFLGGVVMIKGIQGKGTTVIVSIPVNEETVGSRQ